MTYLSFDELIGAITPEQFASMFSTIATTVGLTPLAWPPLGISKTLYLMVGDLFGLAAGLQVGGGNVLSLDSMAAAFARSGFLDYAATVTSGSGPGWLDIAADSFYDEVRSPAVKATGPVTIMNFGGTRGPYAIGQYHLVNAMTKKTYSNTQEFTLAALSDTPVTFEAGEAGSASTTVANALSPVTALVGVAVKPAPANTNTLVGADAQDNAGLVLACRRKLQALNPKLGPRGSYEYFSLKSTVTGYPTLAGGAVNRVAVTTDYYTGSVLVYLANASGVLSAPDVALVQTYLSTMARPSPATLLALPAVDKTAFVTLDVYVPSAYSAGAAAAVTSVMTAYVQGLPLGGTPGSVQGLQRSELVSSIFAGLSYVENVTGVTINSVAADMTMSLYDCARIFPAPTITVHAT